MTGNLLVLTCLAYAAFLFAVAFAAERRAGRGLFRGPAVYTLSLSVYCTAWTFYGAVGYAARSGLEFMTIYLGPTLVLIGWWLLLRKLVAIGRAERITSIADLVSSRYGKSSGLAALVTLVAVVGTTPYIALQLQSVTLSLGAFGATGPDAAVTAFVVAAGLAFFTILFGTRRLDAGERHEGIVAAIAVEAVVKLVALLAVGIFVTWGLNGGIGATIEAIAASPVSDWQSGPGRWAGLIFTSAAAVICLPRMFHVLVVETTGEPEGERWLATASWAFPAYLLAMCLFVVPIAVTGLARLPDGNPDLYVLDLPLSEGWDGLALLAFLGGFSSATSMVIVAAVALATMLSNHVVIPLWLAGQDDRSGATISGDVREIVLRARRGAIVVVLALGWVYYEATGGTAALASIGLISFVGMAQVLPAVVLGLNWEGATRQGAAAGIGAGFAIWAWTMLLPVFEGPVLAALLSEGPFGIAWLRPQGMFGLDSDPLVTTLLLSLGANLAILCVVSLSTRPDALEQVQASRFVHVLDRTAASRRRRAEAHADDLLVMAQRILGFGQARAIFAAEADSQGRAGHPPEVTPGLLEELERRLAGSVGAATAHAMVAGATKEGTVSVADLIAVADETAQIVEYSARLEEKSAELGRTARDLREANAKLTRLSAQKDAFLGQVSHELRTPMTSIRAFSEILQSEGLTEEQRMRYAGIVLDESRRLTRLLDDLLDLGVLESGQIELSLGRVLLRDVLDRAVTAAAPDRRLAIIRDRTAEEIALVTDADRLAQVFINLIANAAKYCDADQPTLEIRTETEGDTLVVDVVDNGSGIAPRDQAVIFEKFARLGDHTAAGGAGLGLAICREIVARLGGEIDYVADMGGAAFRVSLPGAIASAQAAE
ncbi:ATP-binding protein [Jannaschia aquimarina]|uniref:histidine kinase n=1 Tax=Jannaschia aquimarina TaxID=935700 RepID=A0A0D1E9R3_9RHOB|nr:ATP-binding protein [Jannaschia aquimarina]KIT14429.1 Sensor protein KdpD [Jannaschia aquimarina]SNT29488.1 Na+/proline symporter [Jannaschia aquimarina]